jgi:cyclopropane-fatty-acyl-phospholipid synthase
MFWEKQLDQFVHGIGERANVPLKLKLWNGGEYAFSNSPKVTLTLPGAKALKFLLPPSLDNLAEGYVKGHFDVAGRAADIIEAASGLARAGVEKTGRFGRILKSAVHTRKSDAEDIAYHYDVSNDFYKLWLDPRMVYSCAYFPTGTEDLAAAQTAKLDHILNKIMLKPGDRMLDIGCGWGALAMRAAERGAKVVGITLSKNQAEEARERVARAGLANQVDIRIQDYRDVDERFDKITSVGMFEHVGLKNLRGYFGIIRKLLNDGGLAMNHGITSTDPENGATPYGASEFIEKYVFPHGELPHIGLVLKEMEAAGLEALDVESLKRHYARTLQIWAENYEARTEEIKKLVPDLTYRVWRVYLAGCAYAFMQHWVSIHQVLVCKAGAESYLNPTPWSREYMYNK